MKYSCLAFCILALFSCKAQDTDYFASDVNSEQEFFEAMEANTQWPSYRGYFANGYMKNASLPDTFNVETGLNVKWNLDIPGLGLSCPVIWDDLVFITTAISEGDSSGYKPGLYGDIAPVSDSSEHQWMLYCIDKKDGGILWEQEMHKGIPAVKRHPKSSHANTSVATDGKHVVVFIGSEGLYCYDVEGKLIWKRDFGLILSAWHVVESAEWEFCSSPVIYQDKLVIQVDALNQTFVAVLDLESGETIWKQDRDEIATWCTPNIYFEDDKARVVLNGYKHRGGYDLETGEEIWWMDGGGDLPVPVPIIWKDMLYFNSAHGRHAPMMALHNNVQGEIPYPKSDKRYSDDFAWFYDRGGAYMTSVVVYDSLLYRLRWNGNLVCYDARTGEVVYDETVKPMSFIACPVIADGKIFMVSERGSVFIARVGRKFEIINEIPLGGVSLVTPGLVQDLIIFRTAGQLIAVGH